MRYALVNGTRDEAPAKGALEQERAAPSRTPWIVWAMVGAVAAIAAIAYWDEERESRAALEDLALEQATLARSVAAEIHARLALAARDATVASEVEEEGRAPPRALVDGYLALRVRRPGEAAPPPEPGAFQASLPVANGRSVDLALPLSGLTAGFRAIDRPGAVMVLLLPPGARDFHAADGRTVASEELRAALERGEAWRRLPRPQAASLGLPQRTAVAGLAWVDGGRLGRWGVAVVANAQRQRDREWRARWRLLLAVALAGGLVLAFGGLALRRQRKELELERGLAIAEIQRRRDERLERADRAATLGTFAMGIAHEISTPLGVIAGRAEQLLAQVSSDERAVRAARAITEQTERIHQVIRAFLGLARGASPPDQDLSPSEIVAGATALCEHRFARAGVALEAEVPDGLPPVRGDPRLLEHALVNLLLNACDACEAGGRVRLEVSGGEAVAFAVSDDGVGIARTDAARASEPFFTTKPVGTGAGLGLAIVSEIVKHHRGRLSIGPRAPRGTVARIELPADGRRTA